MSNNKKPKYDDINEVSETGDSIRSIPIDELPKGEVYIPLSEAERMIDDALDKRLGKKRDEDNV